MMIRKLFDCCTALLLAVLLLSLTSCGGDGEAAATTMFLKSAKGEVAVSNSSGEDVPLVENLSLYSGYGVETRSSSYAWIGLDGVKLAKMDQDTEITITKEGKKLEIEAKTGSLFFNVTEPLEDDETMDIRTSTMIVGIRGTCGWVETSKDGSSMTLCLLEGTAECTAGEKTAAVRAGEKAVMTEDGKITVTSFAAGDVPSFALEEIKDNSALARAIQADSGLDVLNPPTPTPVPTPSPTPEPTPEPEVSAIAAYRDIIARADSYDFGAGEAGANVYVYSLVQLQLGDIVPTLLIKQQATDNLEYARVFQYDPTSGTVFAPEDCLKKGVVSAKGYHGDFDLQDDGEGLMTIEMNGNTMESIVAINRVTMAGGALHREIQYNGEFGGIPEDLWSREILWYSLDNTSALENWPERGIQPEPTPEPTPDPNVLPSDGDRIVFRGTLNQYSDVELTQLQGLSDAEAQALQDGGTYWIILLDQPQDMTLRSSDPSSPGHGGTVSLIDVSWADGIAQYAGQHLTFSIDPGQTRWPSDASLPLGQPRTSDVHVLG